MRFVPYSNGSKWYQLKSLSRPDREEQDYLRQQGEFSIYREDAFNKHCKELSKWRKYYARLNGRKLRAILKMEYLWFGRQGLEELIYK